MTQSDEDTKTFDATLKANIARVFNEHDREARDSALADLWREDAEMIEADEIFRGRAEISDAVGRLLDRLPPGTFFTPIGNAIVNHDTALLHWQAGLNGEHATVAGNDVAQFREEKIGKLYVYLEPGRH
jgi:hypothetical protein